MKMNVKKKLQSNRGASMILVLALFLVCVMVSSVVMAAASSGVSRNEKRVKQQNGYLAVSSATDLVLEEMKELGMFVGENIVGRYGCQDCTVEGYIEYNGTMIQGYRLDAEYTTNPADKDYVSNPLDDGHLLLPKQHEPYVYTVTDEEKTTLDGLFADMFKRACTQVFMTDDGYREIIKLSLSASDERLPEVSCLFEMSDTYDVSFTLSTQESAYAIVISAMGIAIEGDVTESVEATDEHTIYYKKFVEDTGSYEETVENWIIPIEVTTTTTEISWGEPVVEKGVLSQ